VNDDLAWVPGGTFRMGSGKHDPEERPVHRVTVDGFWMDRYPVTNARFARFVEETGYTTFAEAVPVADDYPDAPQEMLIAGSLVFVQPAGPVDLGNVRNWWQYIAPPNRSAQNSWPRPLTRTSGATSRFTASSKDAAVSVGRRSNVSSPR
jgi:formylglycine-generating enzyme required for sulfatase activity